MSKNHYWHDISRGIAHSIYRCMPDKMYIQMIYYRNFGRFINWKNPQSFTEKINWLKVYDRNPLYTVLADKYAVKAWVEKKIGKEYIIESYGVWDKFEDIDFHSLPNSFVLKCTHDCGGIVIVKDKSKFDTNGEAKGFLNKCLSKNSFLPGREWVYKSVKPRIIAEKYVNDNVAEKEGMEGLIDYKFYCFNGVPRFLYVACANYVDGRKNDLLSYYNLDFSEAPFTRTDHGILPFKPLKPVCFDEMIEIARTLSEGIPFVRVDLYAISGRPYFSEMTFYPGGGFGAFVPQEWEYEIGNWIKLPHGES